MPTQTRLYKTLNDLHKPDVYSLILFTLFKLKDVPEYSTLSELCYVLDHKNLVNLLSYYGGLTITIPTTRDLKLIISALDLYEKVNIEGASFTSTVKNLTKDFSVQEITEAYRKISEVVANYDFRRDPQ